MKIARILLLLTGLLISSASNCDKENELRVHEYTVDESSKLIKEFQDRCTAQDADLGACEKQVTSILHHSQSWSKSEPDKAKRLLEVLSTASSKELLKKTQDLADEIAKQPDSSNIFGDVVDELKKKTVEVPPPPPPPPGCTGGQIYDNVKGVCACPAGKVMKGSLCEDELLNNDPPAPILFVLSARQKKMIEEYQKQCTSTHPPKDSNEVAECEDPYILYFQNEISDALSDVLKYDNLVLSVIFSAELLSADKQFLDAILDSFISNSTRKGYIARTEYAKWACRLIGKGVQSKKQLSFSCKDFQHSNAVDLNAELQFIASIVENASVNKVDRVFNSVKKTAPDYLKDDPNALLLLRSLQNSNLDVADFLLSNGANPNIDYSAAGIGRLPLLRAIVRGKMSGLDDQIRFKAAKLLVRHNVDVEKKINIAASGRISREEDLLVEVVEKRIQTSNKFWKEDLDLIGYLVEQRCESSAHCDDWIGKIFLEAGQLVSGNYVEERKPLVEGLVNIALKLQSKAKLNNALSEALHNLDRVMSIVHLSEIKPIMETYLDLCCKLLEKGADASVVGKGNSAPRIHDLGHYLSHKENKWFEKNLASGRCVPVRTGHP